MKKWIVAVPLLVALAGCKGLKDAQLQAYVGDSQTKVVYKNVGAAASKIPENRKVFFRSIDQATDAGYIASNVAGSGDKPEE